jgi:multimeric flavodoxin WrbA
MESGKGNRSVVLLGSARKDSDTRKLVNLLFSGHYLEMIDLLDYKIHPYDYSGNYPENDDFLPVITTLLTHESIVFATPVYWYAMSGGMKIFFDRLTDLMTIEKKTGRKLKGKKTFLVAVGAEEELPEGFTVPFQLTSNYFGMDFISTYYCRTVDLATSTPAIQKIPHHPTI